MTIEERIQAALTRRPDRDDQGVAKSLRGVTVAMVRAVRAGQPMPEAAVPTSDPRPGAAPCAGTITLDAVAARYDIAAAIRREIGKLKPGVLILETELRVRAAGRDATRFRRAIENTDEFKAHRIKLQLDPEAKEGAWYWGDKSTIAAAVKTRDSV